MMCLSSMEIVVCTACGQRNRIRPYSVARANCGACHRPLGFQVSSGVFLPRTTARTNLVRLERDDLTKNWSVEPTPAGAAYLLIDCSSSMGGLKLERSREGALKYAERALGSRHFVGLISFATEASLVLAATRHIDAMRVATQNLVADGSTNLKNGLTVAIDVLGLESGFRSVVVVSDGKSDEPSAALREGERAKRAGIMITTIGTNDADTNFLARLASESQMHFQTAPAQLAAVIASAALLLPAARP
jgi:Mg-chelatase subunit ChlD